VRSIVDWRRLAPLRRRSLRNNDRHGTQRSWAALCTRRRSEIVEKFVPPGNRRGSAPKRPCQYVARFPATTSGPARPEDAWLPARSAYSSERRRAISAGAAGGSCIMRASACHGARLWWLRLQCQRPRRSRSGGGRDKTGSKGHGAPFLVCALHLVPTGIKRTPQGRTDMRAFYFVGTPLSLQPSSFSLGVRQCRAVSGPRKWLLCGSI